MVALSCLVCHHSGRRLANTMILHTVQNSMPQPQNNVLLGLMSSDSFPPLTPFPPPEFVRALRRQSAEDPCNISPGAPHKWLLSCIWRAVPCTILYPCHKRFEPRACLPKATAPGVLCTSLAGRDPCRRCRLTTRCHQCFGCRGLRAVSGELEFHLCVDTVLQSHSSHVCEVSQFSFLGQACDQYIPVLRKPRQ